MNSSASAMQRCDPKAERSQALRLLKRRLESRRHARGDNQSAACDQDCAGNACAIPEAAAADDASHDNQLGDEREVSIAEQLSSRDIVILAKTKPLPETYRPQSQAENDRKASEQISQELQIPAPQQRTKLAMKWSCRSCQRECIPIRKESRCLWCVLLLLSYWISLKFKVTLSLCVQRPPIQGAPTHRLRHSLSDAPAQSAQTLRVHGRQMQVRPLLLRRGRRCVDPALSLQAQAHGP